MKQTQREVPLLGSEEEVMEFESEWGNSFSISFVFIFFQKTESHVAQSSLELLILLHLQSARTGL